jgi:hypothetical protein
MAASSVSAYALMESAEEPHFEGPSFYCAWQQVSLSDHDCPEPARTRIIKPALSQCGALIECLPAVVGPDDFYTWVAVVRWKAGHHTFAHLALPRASDRARR